MGQIFAYLYASVGVLTVIGYAPQLLKLWRAHSPNDGISLSAWGLWIVTQIITVGYALFQVKDTLLITSSSISLGMMLSVASLVVYNRYFRFATVRS